MGHTDRSSRPREREPVNKRAKISQAEITRVLKATRDAGLPIAKFEIDPDGSVKVYTIVDTAGEIVNDWDRP